MASEAFCRRSFKLLIKTIFCPFLTITQEHVWPTEHAKGLKLIFDFLIQFASRALTDEHVVPTSNYPMVFYMVSMVSF